MALVSAEIAKLILNDPRLDVENIDPLILFESAIKINNSDSLDLLLSDNRVGVPKKWENYDVKLFSSFYSLY